MIARPVGKGRIAYLGAVLDLDLMRSVVSRAVSDAKIESEFAALPANVEVCRRVGATHEVFVLINHGRDPVHVVAPAGTRDVLHGGQNKPAIDLDPQGVAVLTTGMY
jgi:beta-galactosidase